MNRFGTGLFTAVLLVCGTITITSTMVGCGGDESAGPTTAPTAVASPGGAPTFGTQSGMGFSTGDAEHSSGAGSGLMGYNGTGSKGTSGAISDEHPAPKPSFPTTDPVLPAP